MIGDKMVEIQSDDYHDYVIKNGRLIGEFDQMYRKSQNVPWHQDEQENWLDVRVAIELLKQYGPFDFISDFGSGYGYFLNQINQNLGTGNPVLYGYDISKAACAKGSTIFSNIIFQQLDLMAVYSEEELKEKMTEKRDKALFMLRGTMWYVFPEINNVVKNISNIVNQGEFFLVSQNFPPLSSSFTGKNIIPNPQAILDLFKNYFEPLKTIWLEDKISNGNDNWFMAIMERK
jgi:SAM-dependent methyltransferase